VLIGGNISSNSLDAIGSKIQVDSLEEYTIEVSWLRSIGEKQSRYMSGIKVPVGGHDWLHLC